MYSQPLDAFGGREYRSISLLMSLLLSTSAVAEQTTPFCQLFPDDESCNCPSHELPDDFPVPGGPREFDLKTPFVHTTFQSKNGVPEVAITPTKESGAIVFEVNTPSGLTELLIQPAGSDVLLTPAPTPEPRPFRPPSIFSAPLPVGSGARALGIVGVFTGIADDATAASWNPAGLIQLKRPEVSAVYRYSRVENDHTSSSENFLVDEDDYDSHGLNYLTASIPFQLGSLEHNMVFSVNFQEAYDFESSFTAEIKDRGQERITQSADRVFTEQQIDRFVFEPASALPTELEIVSEIVTRSSSRLEQRIDTDLTADLDFKQEGVIDGFSLAAAIELTPRFALGAALNIYQDGTGSGGAIRSRTRSKFTATSRDHARVISRRSTTGSFTATETSRFGVEQTESTFNEFVDEQMSQSSDVRIVEGEIVEENEFDDVHGLNATLGAWWIANDFLTLGASVDLPWSADSDQTRKVTTSTTTFNESKTRVLGTSSDTEMERSDVEFEFPFFATVGAFFLWNPNLYTSLDIRYVDWSSFAYDIKGEGKINPFDGTPHGRNAIKDTGSARMGTEYLLQWDDRKLEIPLRIGLV